MNPETFVEIARAFAATGEKFRNDVSFTITVVVDTKDGDYGHFAINYTGDLFCPYYVFLARDTGGGHNFGTAEEIFAFFKAFRKGEAKLVNGTIQYGPRNS